jgi:hypothetical protein
MNGTDIRLIPLDPNLPPVIGGEPAPGRRARQQLPDYRGIGVHHLLDLSYPNHCADWVLRDLPEREALRQWVKNAFEYRYAKRHARCAAAGVVVSLHVTV